MTTNKESKRKATEAGLPPVVLQQCFLCSCALQTSAHACNAAPESHVCCDACNATTAQGRCAVPGCTSTELVRYRRMPRVATQATCSHAGCGKTVTSDELAKHEAACERRTLTCLVPHCSFRGDAAAFIEHLQAVHNTPLTHGDNAQLEFAISDEHANLISVPGAAPIGHVCMHILVAHGAHFVCVCEFAPRLNVLQMSVGSLCNPSGSGLQQHRYQVVVGGAEGSVRQTGYTWPVSSPFAGRSSNNGHYTGVLVANTITLLPYASAARTSPGKASLITKIAARFTVLPESREVPAPPVPTTNRQPLFAAACQENVINGNLWESEQPAVPPPVSQAPAVAPLSTAVTQIPQAGPGSDAQAAALRAFADAVARRWQQTLGSTVGAGGAGSSQMPPSVGASFLTPPTGVGSPLTPPSPANPLSTLLPFAVGPVGGVGVPRRVVTQEETGNEQI